MCTPRFFFHIILEDVSTVAEADRIQKFDPSACEIGREQGAQSHSCTDVAGFRGEFG